MMKRGILAASGLFLTTEFFCDIARVEGQAFEAKGADWK